MLGPGTADAHVVPPTRRAVVSRGANLAVAGGVVAGTWKVVGDQIAVTWFRETAPPPAAAVDAAVARLATILDRPLGSSVPSM